jgi:hypothetical protein
MYEKVRVIVGFFSLCSSYFPEKREKRKKPGLLSFPPPMVF